MSDTEAPTANYPLPDPARIPVADQVIVRISGGGTDKFLQGQFSQQMADVTDTFSPRAAACSPKGRAYCLTRLVRDGDDVLLALPDSLADQTIAHLRKYLMLFRGTTMNAEPEASIIGLLGQSSASALAGDALNTLLAAGDSMAIEGGRLIRTTNTASGLERFELWRTGALAADSEAALTNIPEDTLTTWQASEIAAGVASLAPETVESYVPQMLNWQHLGGVHFKKGCYTGQEVIARMHFLGQLKKSLFRFACPSANEPAMPGTNLKQGEKTVGDVVSSVKLTNGDSEFLAVVRHDADVSELNLENRPEVYLKPLPLPYKVPEQNPAPASDT